MKLAPRVILFYAASNYLNEDQINMLKLDLGQLKKITDKKFLDTLEKYFDIKNFRDKPFIPEDIWLFNYLMYGNSKPKDFNPLKMGEEIALVGRFSKKGLIAKYETQIMLPQLQLLNEALRLLEVA